MVDYNFVTTRLATGAAVSSVADAEAIATAGITHVISCCIEVDDAPFFAGTKVVHMWNPTADDGSPKTPSWFASSLHFGLHALAWPSTRLYVHCMGGVNRGPSTTYALLRALGFDAATAEAIIRKARPQVQLHYKDDADRALTALGWA